MSTNPLQTYFRQPKLFVSLPSKGLYYKPGTLTGDYTSVPIFSMTGMDEIIMKTPDALFNGESTIRLIQSCCPYITNAKEVPSLDIDVLLIAIRMATYGENMSIKHVCKKCKAENEFDIALPEIIDHYSEKTFDNQLIAGDLVINLKPLSYSEMTKFNLENFKLQQMLKQLEGIVDENNKQQKFDEIYSMLANIQVDLFVDSIESIRTPTETVTNKQFILEWLTNSAKESYSLIKEKLSVNKDSWALPKYPIKCSECGTEDKIEISMDQSNFFV